MMKYEIEGRRVLVHGDPACGVWLLYMTGEHEAEDQLHALCEALDAASQSAYCLVMLPVRNWNRDLSPWPAPPVFGREAFDGGAEAALNEILQNVWPALCAALKAQPLHCGLVGYSLAGLFALWAAAQTDVFDGAAAVSPSVWYPDWLAYSESHPLHAAHVYLSLGDREAKTRNPLMATVADCIEMQHRQLKQRGVNTVLQWNPGNHFADVAQRVTRGAAWLLAQYAAE